MTDARNHPRPDPRKLALLVEILRGGMPRTYAELAGERLLGLGRRSLQLYIEQHLPAAGYTVERNRGPGSRAADVFHIPSEPAEAGAVNRAALELAFGVLRGLFPVEGTAIDQKRGRSARVMAFASGAPALTARHQQALFRWITAAERDPPSPVTLRYRAARHEGSTRAAPSTERVVWPLGVVLREGRRVYLVGLVEPALGLESAQNFALERVVPAAGDTGVRPAPAAQFPPTEFLQRHRPRPQDVVNAPFGLVRPGVSPEPVVVHVRFTARQAVYIRGRRWHARQRESPGPDGGVELKFGPVDLGEALGWCSQWFQGLTVLGDATLRDRYERSLRERLEAQGIQG